MENPTKNLENPLAKLVKTPSKKSKEKALSKGIQSPKSKVSASTCQKCRLHASTTASSETNVPHTKSPTIAERMGVLPSPFKHIPSKKEEKQVSTGENKKQMKILLGERGKASFYWGKQKANEGTVEKD